MAALNEKKEMFRQLWDQLKNPKTWAIWLVSVVIATVAGPFGTFQALSFGERLFFWAAIVSVAIVVGTLSHLIACSLADPARKPAQHDTIGVALLTALLSPMVWFLGWFFNPTPNEAIPAFGWFVLYVCIIGAALTCLRRALVVFTAEGELPFSGYKPVVVPEAEPRLMRRLPCELKGKILRLTACNHHVEVVTEKGSTTLRLRLVDAIDEMDPIEGFCIHRSHWVAQDAIQDVQRLNAHKTIVLLCNGEEVPVGPKYRCNLVKAGFLQENRAA